MLRVGLSFNTAGAMELIFDPETRLMCCRLPVTVTLPMTNTESVIDWATEDHKKQSKQPDRAKRRMIGKESIVNSKKTTQPIKQRDEAAQMQRNTLL